MLAFNPVNKSQETAKRNICSSILKASGSSTKSLISNMKATHQIEVLTCSEFGEDDDDPKLKSRNIDDYFTKNVESVEEVIAKLVAVDVCEVLYKSSEIRSEEQTDQENERIEERDFDYEDDNSVEELTDYEDNHTIFINELQKIVVKVRKMVKIFRKSPVRNDTNLQPQTLGTFGKEKNLLLDCIIRWNFLLKMLERFYEMRKEVKIAMLQLDYPFDLNNQELLAPLEVAVQYFCKEEADLVLSEKALAIANVLLQKPKIRIKERRNPELAFIELKTNTKIRACDVYIAKNGSGGGPSTVKDLSETEERLVGILSKISVEGAPIPEADGSSNTTRFHSIFPRQLGQLWILLKLLLQEMHLILEDSYE
ncbi:hypothetical protein CBL_20365 [Carabus blaptoides fortunei]